MSKSNAILAAVTGGSFLASFLLFTPLAEGLFLNWFPSDHEDDVRFDLFLPVFVSACLISFLISFLFGQSISKLIGKELSYKTHGKFALIVPFLFAITYLLISAILLLLSGIGLYNEKLDGFLIYLIGFTVITAGYYKLLDKS